MEESDLTNWTQTEQVSSGQETEKMAIHKAWPEVLTQNYDVTNPPIRQRGALEPGTSGLSAV